MKPKRLSLLFLLLLIAGRGHAQTSVESLTVVLKQSLQKPSVTQYQLLEYLRKRVTKLPHPQDSREWVRESDKIRRHLLDSVIYHGWPRQWVEARPRFEEVGVINSKDGYRIRKLRYEIVPGFWAPALMYEPDHLKGRVPAILNLMGHFPEGKASSFEQTRSINYALNGILALDLEWPGFGELADPQNSHWFAAALDLVGANAEGLFYLAMRRGLDYLSSDTHVDPKRIGVTGLSGGGWQTLVLSGLDPRVAVAVPVAGTCSLISKLDRPDPDNIGDIEEVATDLLAGQDYAHLVALRAPRPTLLIYNATDDCCYRAPLVKPYIFDNVRSFFQLFNKEDVLGWHENTYPGTHNYQLDNREQSYKFFSKYFDLPAVRHEIYVAQQIRSYEELEVGIPKDNLTILGLARELADKIKQQPVPGGAGGSEWATNERQRLRTIVRYSPTEVEHASMLDNTRDQGIDTLSYRFDLNNHLGATGVLFRAITTPTDAPVTIVINDEGMQADGKTVLDDVNRGEQVLALDLLFFGNISPEAPWEYAELLATTGDRPVGIESAQLIALANWIRQFSATAKARLETLGRRSQTIALVAASIQPELFSQILIRAGVPSLQSLLAIPVEYQTAPDLFCLDLYKEFDLDQLAKLAGPTKVDYVH
jgi:Acetyl xylan esterase (AXE1)